MNSSFISTPTYCVDSQVIDIFKERWSCMIDSSAIKELAYLRTQAASDYQRAHELIAHIYFLDEQNPHRVADCTLADFEYIPLLPLSWRTGMPTNTLCTANGYCPSTSNPNPLCSYKRLIDDVVKYVEYVTVTKKQDMAAGVSKFSVASTFNLRTCMGFGLPNSNRNGKIYNDVTVNLCICIILYCFWYIPKFRLDSNGSVWPLPFLSSLSLLFLELRGQQLHRSL
jgi:hypothetical protein